MNVRERQKLQEENFQQMVKELNLKIIQLPPDEEIKKYRGYNRIVEIDGKEKPIQEWAKECGLPADVISRRISEGKVGRELLIPLREKASRHQNKYTHHLVTHGGETKTLKEWSETTGIRLNTLISRMINGVEGSNLFAPVKTRRK